MNRIDLIKTLKKIGLVHKQSATSSSLTNERFTEYYVNLKKAFGYPKVLDIISNELWKQIDKKTTCVAASGYGGVPLATLISSRHDLHLTLVYDEQKRIEGYIPNKNDYVAIVDDAATTGGSLRRIIKILIPTDANIVGCYIVVKRGKVNIPIPLKYLMSTKDLL